MATDDRQSWNGDEGRDRLFALCTDLELGMLEGSERREIEELLNSEDPAALSALASARECLGALGESADPSLPPPTLKQQMFEQIEEPAPGAAAAPPTPTVRVPKWAALGWAVAAAMVAFVLVSNQRSSDLERALEVIEQQQASLEQTNDRYQKLFEILAAPGTRSIELEAAGRAEIRAFWNDQTGLAVTAEGLEAPERGRAFQLWAIPNEGAPVSVEIFRPDENDRALIFAQPTISSAESQALAITEEAAEGAEQPTSDPIWMGGLR